MDSDSSSEQESIQRAGKTGRKKRESIRERWRKIRMDGLKDEEKIDVVFPVTRRPNQLPQYQAFDWQLIKEVRKAVAQNGLQSPVSQALLENALCGQLVTPYNCQQLASLILTPTQKQFCAEWITISSLTGVARNGLQSPVSQALLENVLCGQLVTPYDCQQLASLILTPTQKLLWRDKFIEYCEIKAVENLGRQQGYLLLRVDVDHYTGAGQFAEPELKLRILLEVLRESAQMALWAFITLPEASKEPISFTFIKQEVSEPYMTFIDRLRDAVEKQIEHRKPESHY